MADGRIYLVAMFRTTSDDTVEGGPADGRVQLAREIQEAIDDTGLPVCEFHVVNSAPASFEEWDTIRKESP